MNTKIETAAVTAEISTDGVSTLITVSRPHIRGFDWHICLHSTGVYADYAGGCDEDCDVQAVITEYAAQTDWFVNTIASDPERAIMRVWDNLRVEIERAADDAADDGLFSLFEALVDPAIDEREAGTDPANVERYADAVGDWPDLTRWQATKVASAVKWHLAQLEDGIIPCWPDLRRDLPTLLATEYSMDIDRPRDRVRVTLYNPTVGDNAQPLTIEISDRAILAWQSEDEVYALDDGADAARIHGEFLKGDFITVAGWLGAMASEAEEAIEANA